MYRVFPGELVSSQGVLYCCIDGGHVFQRGVYTGALVFGAWIVRECHKWRSVATELAASIGSSGRGWLVVTDVWGFGEVS